MYKNKKKIRQISLDTETTGLLYYKGHRIIEIGCVEIINRKITENIYHSYINPKKNIDKEARKITGITDNFLKDKPLFNNIIDDFFNFINNSDEIIIHNASFDVNFINNELKLNQYKIKNIKSHFKIFDTLSFARSIHPGKKNNLNALCKRYNIEHEERIFHGALLDAYLLAKIYLEMTAKQSNLILKKNKKIKEKPLIKNNFKILNADKQEFNMHIKYIEHLKKITPYL